MRFDVLTVVITKIIPFTVDKVTVHLAQRQDGHVKNGMFGHPGFSS